MTLDTLQDILTSKPRLRVVRIAAKWLVLAILSPVKLVLKLPALPFLWLSNILYDVTQSMFGEVGDIQGEIAERELREDMEDDTED